METTNFGRGADAPARGEGAGFEQLRRCNGGVTHSALTLGSMEFILPRTGCPFPPTSALVGGTRLSQPAMRRAIRATSISEKAEVNDENRES